MDIYYTYATGLGPRTMHHAWLINECTVPDQEIRRMLDQSIELQWTALTNYLYRAEYTDDDLTTPLPQWNEIYRHQPTNSPQRTYRMWVDGQ